MSDKINADTSIVLAVLNNATQPMTRAQIYAADYRLVDETYVSHELATLRAKGLATRNDDGTWQIDETGNIADLPDEQESAADDPAEHAEAEATKSAAPLAYSKAAAVIEYAITHGPVTAADVRTALSDEHAGARLNQAATCRPPKLVRHRNPNAWGYLYSAPETPRIDPDKERQAANAAERNVLVNPEHARDMRAHAARAAADATSQVEPRDRMPVHIQDIALWASGQLVINAEINGNDTTLTLDEPNARRLIHYIDRIAEPTP